MDLSSAGCSVACQDAAGRIVLGPVPLASNAFDIAELRSGAYVARITSADGSVRSAWFVKE